jgi:hypothetical protein
MAEGKPGKAVYTGSIPVGAFSREPVFRHVLLERRCGE